MKYYNTPVYVYNIILGIIVMFSFFFLFLFVVAAIRPRVCKTQNVDRSAVVAVVVVAAATAASAAVAATIPSEVLFQTVSVL